MLAVLVFSWAILAATAQEQPSDPLQGLIKQLRGRDAVAKVKAAQELAKMGEQAQPASKALCEAVLDKSSKVAIAAMESLEKVNPEIHKPLSTLILDQDYRNQVQAAKELGSMGDKAEAAVPVLIDRLRKEMAKDSSEVFFDELARACFGALQQIGPEDPENIKTVKLLAGPTTRNHDARTAALLTLEKIAGDDEKRRKEFLPVMRSALDNPQCQLTAIKIVAEYGTLAKDLLPTLKKLKLSPREAIREAAKDAVDRIENP